MIVYRPTETRYGVRKYGVRDLEGPLWFLDGAAQLSSQSTGARGLVAPTPPVSGPQRPETRCGRVYFGSSTSWTFMLSVPCGQ
jgi:hypothetical protein